MFQLGGAATNEMSQLARGRHPKIAMVGVGGAGDPADGFVGLGVPVREEPPVVRLAELPGIRVAHTPFDAAGEVDLTAERATGRHGAESHPALVVPVAPPTRD